MALTVTQTRTQLDSAKTPGGDAHFQSCKLLLYKLPVRFSFKTSTQQFNGHDRCMFHRELERFELESRIEHSTEYQKLYTKAFPVNLYVRN